MKKLNQMPKTKTTQTHSTVFTVSARTHIQRVNVVAFQANNYVRSNVVGITYSEQMGKLEFFSWFLKPETVVQFLTISGREFHRFTIILLK